MATSTAGVEPSTVRPTATTAAPPVDTNPTCTDLRVRYVKESGFGDGTRLVKSSTLKLKTIIMTIAKHTCYNSKVTIDERLHRLQYNRTTSLT